MVAQVHEVWPWVGIHNLFGPTEAAVEVAWSDVSSAPGVVTIGAPVWNTETLVLDNRLRPVPVGIPGELYLGGVQIARGYAGQPGMSAERFVADPYGEPGSRLYRTGDLVRWNTAGEIEYLGRTDFQVKLRGQRIELGEIEAVLAAVPGVVHAAATVAATETGADHLVAYLAPADIDVEAVKSAAAQSLPSYMVPSVWMLLDEVPLNSAGKLDRRALPAPDFGAVAAGYVAPATDSETSLAAVFAHLLGVEQVSVTESFFDIGGNSLSAMRLAARASDALGVEVSVRDVFSAPSVRELIAATSGHGTALAPITATVPRPQRIPLSFAQQRMWFINQFNPGSAAYNMPAVLRFGAAREVDTRLDLEALRLAVIDVLSRQEVLRTTFPAEAGVPWQHIGDVNEFDARHIWSVVDSEADLVAAATTGFDLTADWPVRVRVLPEGDSVLFALVLHHIAADGESFAPLLTDMIAAYMARSAGRIPDFAPLEVQFADYAIWQHTQLGSPDDPDSVVGRQLSYWREQLRGIPDVLALPTDRPRPPVASQHGGNVGFSLPEELTERIGRTARAHGVTPFMVVHGALAVLLARLSGSDDITIGTPVAGRGQSVLDRLVGMFVNTLVLRTRVDFGATFDDILADVKATDLAAFTNDAVPFEAIVDALNPIRSEAFAPLTQVWFSVQQDAGAELIPADGITADDALVVSSVDTGPAPVQVDLIIDIDTRASAGHWQGSARFATDLFDEASIELLVSRLVMVLDEVTKDSSVVIGDIGLLDEAEATAIASLESGVDIETDGTDPVIVGEQVTLADLVVRRVEQSPSQLALIAGDVRLSFAELGSAVTSLAQQLGVAAEDAVAVSMPRSASLAVAVYAIAVSGAQFVPLDPEALTDRASYILRTSGAQVIVVPAGGVSAEIAEAAARAGARLIEVDDEAVIEAARGADAADLESVVHVPRMDAAAYTMFTSGSTGRPKGVVVSHRSVVTHLLHDVAANELTARDVFAQVLSFTFDPSVLEFFRPVAVGGPLVMLTQDEHRDPAQLVSLFVRNQVSTAIMVPSMLATILEIAADTSLRAIPFRVLCVGGETMPAALVRRAFELWPGLLVPNQYGPTETTIYATRAELSPGVPVTIGRPLSKTVARVLDERLHPVPVGVAGELYLGGDLVARGYAGRPGLTAERFIADLYGSAGERLYRTGDVVRWTASGELMYVGRSDFQVKLRGQRLELGEIETVLASAPGVSHAAAALTGSAADAVLVGYVSPASVDLNAVKEHASASLAAFMVPSVWVRLETMPLSASGKTDRRALPAVGAGGADREFVAPETGREQVLAAVFAELLGVDEVSVAESFFDLGGNSLSAMRLAARASDALGVEVSVRDVFDAPSVRELIVAVAGNSAALAPITAADPRPAHIPLSFAQQRMWFLNQFDPAAATYNIPVALSVSGDLDVDALRQAVMDVVARHEVLRTTFPAVDGEPYQQIHDVDWAQANLDWQVVDSQDEVAAAMSTGFDVARRPAFRVRLLRTAPAEWVFAAVIHHIVGDGESMRPLVTDVMTAYIARSAGHAPEFAPLEVQFADVAIWQHTMLGDPRDPESVAGGQLAYWRRQLGGLPDVLELPADRPRPIVASSAGAQIGFTVPADVSARIDELSARRGVTAFMTVHAALAVLLSRLTATDDIAVATPIAGRGDRVLDPLVGMFVNTLVLRAEVDPVMSFSDLLDQVRSADLGAFANADVPFEAVVDAVDPVRSQAFAPLAQVMLTLVHTGGSSPDAQNSDGVQAGGVRVTPIDAPLTFAQRDLSVNIGVVPGGEWGGSLTYATDLFDEVTMRTFARRLVMLLDALTAAPDDAVGTAPIIATDERDNLAQWSSGSVMTLTSRTITDSLAVLRSGDRINGSGALGDNRPGDN
ncbi:non-ribosomal peptide synthetase [Gordonia sp. (in: high G+C Gram-positive bacteria)]|uniref:non-ribosomal peptide synthetase n=1 Tax=Gordonia sp. (in: high G+C Gram-positive bacteria) TaxID=84139 RepID=UPI00257BE4D7|nr:non-ribosomal peptide synthetase [Gordonia sp. (in: high G+C Gram-positive bacteria)]